MASAEGPCSESAIDIDGSIMEGGGQILRNSVSFACLLNSTVHVYNIRAGRSKPGLKMQHMTGLQLVRDICQGHLDGGRVGSSEATLVPCSLTSGTFTADIQTAGSVCLLMQVALPCLLYAPKTSDLVLKGGTNADLAPPIDYMMDVLKPAVEKFGVHFDCNIIRRGYYPKGGGEVQVKVKPTKQLRPVELTTFGTLLRITGRAFVAGVLPFKIAKGMAREATRLLKKRFPDVALNVEPVQEPRDKAFGVPAESVAEQAVTDLLRNIDAGGCVDEYLQDQLIIFMALAEGTSRIRCGPITLHTRTAIHVAEKIIKAKFNITAIKSTDTSTSSDKDSPCIIECTGIGLQNPTDLSESPTMMCIESGLKGSGPCSVAGESKSFIPKTPVNAYDP